MVEVGTRHVGLMPKDTTRATAWVTVRRARRQASDRGKAVGAGSSFHAPILSRPQLTNPVASVSPGAPLQRRSRKSEPSLFRGKHAGTTQTLAALADVANTDDFEDDTSCDAAPAQTLRESQQTKFSRAEQTPAQGGGGQWSTEEGDRPAKWSKFFSGQKPVHNRVSQQDPTLKRRTRAQTGGDDARMWGSKPKRKRGTAASADGAHRARHTPMEDSPSTKRQVKRHTRSASAGSSAAASDT
eukprot:COSAG02_NODE_6839_length_3333_cov_23.587199_1_plen_241_part_10